MSVTAITVLIVVISAVLIMKTKAKGLQSQRRGVIKGRSILTKHEQPMYFRLGEALPEYIVLCQVAFSALIDARDRATRNTFDRKVADFVICRKSFGVVAVVELDDSSHKGREEKDEQRDAILQNAGYTVLRYKGVPDVDKIRADFKNTLQSKENTVYVS